MNSLKVVPMEVSEVDMPVELKSLLELSGLKDHYNLKRKFDTKIASILSPQIEGSYKSYSYEYKGRVVSSYTMTESLAKFFASKLDEAKGYEYSLALEVKAKEVDALRVNILEAKILKLELTQPKLKIMSSQKDRRSLHVQRKELFEQGVCDHWTETVVHHYFPVNAFGEELGYVNTGKGKRQTIKID
jgi:hypothetical protein